MGQFREIFDELALRISPGEIRITLVETGFGQCLHHLWPGERLGEKNGVGIFLAHAFDQILPESDWFGVRIIHTKDAHPALGPKQNDALHLRPEVAPVFAVKIQWINIFVLFRRVLRVFDRAVGAFVEPIGMLFDVRMIGRTIDREIEGDFHCSLSHLFL